MNKYQENIDILKDYINENYIDDGFIAKNQLLENISVLQELVDKATPKKVVYEKGKNIYGGFVRVCPTCKDKIIISPQAKESERYCRYCGQRIESED